MIEPFRMYGEIVAEVFGSKIGLPLTVALQLDTDKGDTADLTLTAVEANDLMLWLQCALSGASAAVETPPAVASNPQTTEEQLAAMPMEDGEPLGWAHAKATIKRLMRELAMSDAGGKLALADRDRLRAALEGMLEAWGCMHPTGTIYPRLEGKVRQARKALSAEPADSGHETTAVPAITLLEKELQADRAYAWSWHCNIAVPIMDQFGCSHESANRSAAELMRHLFHVDVTTFPEWKAFGWNQDKCECGCCLPPPGAVCAGCGKRASEKADGAL